MMNKKYKIYLYGFYKFNGFIYQMHLLKVLLLKMNLKFG